MDKHIVNYSNKIIETNFDELNWYYVNKILTNPDIIKELKSKNKFVFGIYNFYPEKTDFQTIFDVVCDGFESIFVRELFTPNRFQFFMTFLPESKKSLDYCDYGKDLDYDDMLMYPSHIENYPNTFEKAMIDGVILICQKYRDSKLKTTNNTSNYRSPNRR